MSRDPHPSPNLRPHPIMHLIRQMPDPLNRPQPMQHAICESISRLRGGEPHPSRLTTQMDLALDGEDRGVDVRVVVDPAVDPAERRDLTDGLHDGFEVVHSESVRGWCFFELKEEEEEEETLTLRRRCARWPNRLWPIRPRPLPDPERPRRPP